MKTYKKNDYPVSDVRRFLEPGPIVLVSSKYKAETNIMTMGWHMVMEFTPSTIGCIIAAGNHSFDLVRRSKQCVINIPTVEMAETVVKIGNCSGSDVDKFAEFGLTAEPPSEVGAPLIGECFANFECQLADAKMISRYNMFVFEVVKAHVATSPRLPKTIHYRGDGAFMMSGTETMKYRKWFRPAMP